MMFEDSILNRPQPFVPVALSNRKYRPWALTFVTTGLVCFVITALVPASPLADVVRGATIVIQIVALYKLWPLFKQ